MLLGRKATNQQNSLHSPLPFSARVRACVVVFSSVSSLLRLADWSHTPFCLSLLFNIFPVECIFRESLLSIPYLSSFSSALLFPHISCLIKLLFLPVLLITCPLSRSFLFPSNRPLVSLNLLCLTTDLFLHFARLHFKMFFPSYSVGGVSMSTQTTPLV